MTLSLILKPFFKIKKKKKLFNLISFLFEKF
jgi:hypothetical protein